MGTYPFARGEDSLKLSVSAYVVFPILIDVLPVLLANLIVVKNWSKCHGANCRDGQSNDDNEACRFKFCWQFLNKSDKSLAA
jgi:hypothetical protein